MTLKSPDSKNENEDRNDRDSDSFFFDKETFKVIYQIEKNRKKRSSISVYLFHIKFLELEELAIKREEINKSLRKIVKQNIRFSDVICQWYDNHFLVILYNIEEENIKIIKNRITNNYKKLNFNDQFKIEFKHSKVS